MPGESESISQGDIEELLRKAQAAVAPPPDAPAAATRQVTDDMSFLLNQAQAALWRRERTAVE
jgi:hypothetical protein